jgi:hypothetical protein
MSAPPFPLFHEVYASGERREAYAAARHDVIAAQVPAELATEWRQSGFGEYGGGLLWTVPPDKPSLDHRDWPGLDGTGIEVLRTAFASICLWQGGEFLWLNVHTGKITAFIGDAEIMFDSTLIERNFRRGVLLEPLFRKARQRFGAIGSEECFGFAPLPALGGAVEEEYLIKTSLREYVGMAAHALR